MTLRRLVNLLSIKNQVTVFVLSFFTIRKIFQLKENESEKELKCIKMRSYMTSAFFRGFFFLIPSTSLSVIVCFQNPSLSSRKTDGIFSSKNFVGFLKKKVILLKKLYICNLVESLHLPPAMYFSSF